VWLLLISFTRELITVNEEINRKFSALQKNYLMQQQQFCEQSVSLNESIILYDKANKERKALDAELQVVKRNNMDLSAKASSLEKLVARKEKDISDLLQRLNNTIKEYEEQLERKEEQVSNDGRMVILVIV
jgi:vacuolar-type H+-ATPase subunit I/STV1